MIYSTFVKADTTLYEGAPGTPDALMRWTNTGNDEILEVRKIVSSSATATTYLSRALLRFDIDWTKIDSGIAWTGAKAYLNLYTTEVSQLDDSKPIFTIRPLAESFNEGKGRENNKPQTTKGASWKYRTGEYNTGLNWTTSSYGANTTGSWEQSTHSGGGTWQIQNYADVSIEDETADLRADVTDIATAWSSSTYTNKGFIVSLTSSQETDANRYGSFKFFSKQTHTIYPPRLEIMWDDHTHTGTDTLSELDMTDTESVFFYLKNNKGAYKRGSKIRFWCLGREKYPIKTHGTTSAEHAIRPLSGSSLHYTIKDAKTGETVIPYDTAYTKVSANASGNYFDIYSDSLFEERYYTVQLRYSKNTDLAYYDIKDKFKVVR
tara:strand:+ start:11675 stop:12808 length:1134 start_codon:yes stop_codon:yes gene_type:complete